ncbi:hypothetical protein [Desulfosporosinus sp. FKA]|uniref:hypothetical protein n=1 Tax=Desulfosporosinus sp. FKA TaxID=1969834 RepID=UPI000B4A30C8|nr:hypothetical protein [Desulfosporosinus sp. FKA]
MYCKIDGKEYTSISSYAKEFGISYCSLKRNLEYRGTVLIEKNSRKYIEKKFLEESIKESKQIIGFREIVEELVRKLNSNMDSTSCAHLNKLITFVSGNNFFGVTCMTHPVYKIYDSLNFYIYKKDRNLFEEGIKDYLLLYKKPYDVKVEILCNDTAFQNKKMTVKFIKEYIKYVDKKTLCSYVEAVNFLRLTSVKDLSLYTDEEISKYIKLASKDMTKAGCTNLISLYTYMQNNVTCKSDTVLQYDTEVKNKKDSTPYDAEIYLKLAYMIFNEEYWKSHNMIQKAILKERNAKIWLYHAMHFVCDWRTKDIIEEIPRIRLDRPPKQVLEDIASGTLTNEQFKLVSDEITMRVNYKPSKPSKIKRHKNSSPLRLYIPESLSPVIGMLIMVCEAHNQINNNQYKDALLCHLKKLDIDSLIKFFGNDYNDLFAGHIMSNLRATKSHMTMLSDTGEELGTDGYLIASFARSHTGGINRIPQVTSRYLQAKMDGYSVDDITVVLFERGVCSFVPYLLCKVLAKEEFEKANIKEQTIIMNNLPLKAYDIENLIKIDDTISVNTKEKVEEIIQWANEDNIHNLIRDALNSIINGECIGKNEGVTCLRKAFSKECSEKSRETCIGCGYEMYVKGFLMELHDEIRFQEHSLDIAKTQAEKIKRTAILEKKLYPTVHELLVTVKYVYGQDIEDYKKLFNGGDKDGNACIC